MMMTLKKGMMVTRLEKVNVTRPVERRTMLVTPPEVMRKTAVRERRYHRGMMILAPALNEE